MTDIDNAYAIIMAGGSGTRFWPLSRGDRPKQFLALDGERSLLARTLERLEGLVPDPQRWILTRADLVDRVTEDLPDFRLHRGNNRRNAGILADPVTSGARQAVKQCAKLVKDPTGQTCNAPRAISHPRRTWHRLMN